MLRLTLGMSHVGALSSPWTPQQEKKYLVDAMGLGVLSFDTACTYGQGDSERILGRALGGARQRVHITTKAGYQLDLRARLVSVVKPLVKLLTRGNESPQAMRPEPTTAAVMSFSTSLYAGQDFSPNGIEASLRGSLRRLCTDYVDDFLLHSPPAITDELLVLKLKMLQDAGLARRLGVSCRTFADAHYFVEQRWVSVLQVPLCQSYSEFSRLSALATANGVSLTVREIFRAVGGSAWQTAARPTSDSGYAIEDLLTDLLAFPAVESVVVRTRDLGHLRSNHAAVMGAHFNKEL